MDPGQIKIRRSHRKQNMTCCLKKKVSVKTYCRASCLCPVLTSAMFVVLLSNIARCQVSVQILHFMNDNHIVAF